MKLLALTVAGTPIQLPGQVATATNAAGTFGINIIRLAIDFLFIAATLLIFGYIVFGGWKFIISQGEKKAVQEAKDTIVFSVIGLIVISVSFLIVNVIGAFFKVPILGK